MTEANEQDVQDKEQKRPLTLRAGGTLALRRPVETGQVRQSFSHGRTKQVAVEVRKRRAVTPGVAEPSRPEPAPATARAQPSPGVPAAAEPGRRLAGAPRTLTAEEHAMRVRVLQDARKADDDARYRAALAEADRRREEEERLAGHVGVDQERVMADDLAKFHEEAGRMKNDAHSSGDASGFYTPDAAERSRIEQAISSPPKVDQPKISPAAWPHGYRG